jgi:hypothetical protein
MTPRVVWLDTSKRRNVLIEAFEEAVDWFGSAEKDISSQDLVLVHLTDLQVTKKDAYIDKENFADKDLNENLVEKLKTFRDAIRKLSGNTSVPLIVVYTGDVYRQNDEPNKLKSLQKQFIATIPNYPTDFLRLAPGISRECEVSVLKTLVTSHLQADTQSEASQKIRSSDEAALSENDVASAIDLVAEVVAWLKVPRESLSPEMQDLRNRLEKFGTEGEILVDILADKVPEEEVRERLKQKVAEIEKGRVELWKKAGMISTSEENKS